MNRGSISYWDTLEQWSRIAFIGAGVLLLGHAALMSLHAFTDVTGPVDVFAPIGHLLALVGLAGLYRAASDSVPRVARIGAAGAAGIGVGWAVLTLLLLAREIGGQAPGGGLLLGILSVLVLVSTMLSYALFAILSLRSGVVSRRVGLLAVLPAVLLVVLLVERTLLGASPLGGVGIGAGLAASMLALGYTLSSDDVPRERASLDSDVAHG